MNISKCQGAAMVLFAAAVFASVSAGARDGDASGMPMLLSQAGQPAQRPSAAQIQGELDALIKAARAEGEVTFYISLPELLGKRVGDAFTAKYGVKTNMVRLVSTPMITRYFAEAESGNIAADLLFVASRPTAYMDDGVKKGWVEPISAANLPVIRSGEFPARFYDGNTVIVQVVPWVISYDADKVKGADIPKTWADVLNPKWKGQLITSDPRTGGVYAAYWKMIIDNYGEKYLDQVRAMNPRLASGGVPAVQSLAAGEGVINTPSIVALVQSVKTKGANVDYVMPDINTGVESYVVLTARARAKHPNAARLLAHYVLTAEGNKVVNADPGSVTLYDTAGLPKNYQKPDDSGGMGRLTQLAKMLGFQ